ncbi:MAG: SRPBCC family protein [Deltaproteobacteria bacterium]|nr:SRPBCC family protein [Deltaproteobacteria bacterium]
MAYRCTALVSFGTGALALVFVPGSASSVQFNKTEKGRLKQGKIVKKPLSNSRQGGFYGGTGWIVVDAPPDVVWAAISDWSSYSKIFPNTVSAEEISRKGDRTLLKMELGHKLVNVTYHCQLVRDNERKILSFKLVENLPHDIESARGYWRLFPQEDGRTLVAYVVAVRIPMGLVNLLGAELEIQLEGGLLNVPKHLKSWVESPAGSRYRKMVADVK